MSIQAEFFSQNAGYPKYGNNIMKNEYEYMVEISFLYSALFLSDKGFLLVYNH